MIWGNSGSNNPLYVSGMKRIVPVLIGLTALLTACPQPTPPVDPTTISFTATGSAPTAANTQAVPLTTTWGNAQPSVGTLSADKKVNLTLAPALYDTAPEWTLQNWKDGIKDCDTTKFTIEKNARYVAFTNFYYERSDTQDRFMRAGTIVNNSDGTQTVTYYTFWFVKTAGKASGSITCGTQGNTYDLTLNPGWNVATTTYVRDATTRVVQGPYVHKSVPTDYKLESNWITYTSTK